MKYNQISTEFKAYELCFYFEDIQGVETLESLYNWEAIDYANRRLIKVNDYAEANKIVNSRKLLKSYC